MKDMIEWARPRRAYAAGWEGRAGSIRLFNISWNSLRAFDDGQPWALRTRLPGYEDKSWHRETEDEAKGIAVLVLTKWLDSIGAQMKPAGRMTDTTEPSDG